MKASVYGLSDQALFKLDEYRARRSRQEGRNIKLYEIWHEALQDYFDKHGIKSTVAATKTTGRKP